jgi:hypothetical protein
MGYICLSTRIRTFGILYLLNKNWRGREEGEDPGRDGKKRQKGIFMC